MDCRNKSGNDEKEVSYAELSITTNFTFLTGASHPHEYMVRAAELGLGAVAVTDTNTFAGIVRAHAAAKELGVKFIVGVRLVLQDGPDILALPKTREAYARLCRLLTIGKRRTTKGQCELYLKDVMEWSEGSVLIISGEMKGQVRRLIKSHKDEIYLGMAPQYDGQDHVHFAGRAKLAQKYHLPLVALGNVLMHKGARRRLAELVSETPIQLILPCATSSDSAPMLSSIGTFGSIRCR